MTISTSACSKCGAALYPDDLFCAGCGSRVNAPVPVAPGAEISGAQSVASNAPRAQMRTMVMQGSGTALLSPCSACSAQLFSGDIFCPACGKPVEDRRSTMSTLAPTAGDHASVDKAWEETRRRLDDATAGQYEIMKELGRGGFAVVYLG